MTELKHTPGPWIVSKTTVYALNDDGYNRFSALVQDAHTSLYELEANARLIAAAPDLLKHLLKITNSIPRVLRDEGLLIDAIETIAKATGKTS